MKLDYSSMGRSANRFPEGRYDFVVVASKFKKSKAKGEMIEVTLRMTDTWGNSHEVSDCFGQWNLKKIEQFYRATGLRHLSKSPELNAADLLHARGRCIAGLESGPYHEIQSYLPPIRTVLPRRRVIEDGDEPSTALFAF
jgi:hypothetical protein